MTSLTTPCAWCGHSYSFHGKSMDTACKAMGCASSHAMRYREGPCPGYVPSAPRAETR